MKGVRVNIDQLVPKALAIILVLWPRGRLNAKVVHVSRRASASTRKRHHRGSNSLASLLPTLSQSIECIQKEELV